MERTDASAEFRRMLKWIILIAGLMVAAALIWLGATGDLTADMVIATTLGVFFAVLLGCGLFAAAFFSDKSGHDAAVTEATRSERSVDDVAVWPADSARADPAKSASPGMRSRPRERSSD